MVSLFTVLFVSAATLVLQLNEAKEDSGESSLQIKIPTGNADHEIRKRHTWIHKEDSFKWDDEEGNVHLPSYSRRSRAKAARSKKPKNKRGMFEMLPGGKPNLPLVYGNILTPWPFSHTPYSVYPLFCNRKRPASFPHMRRRDRGEPHFGAWNFNNPFFWFVLPEPLVDKMHTLPRRPFVLKPTSASVDQSRKKKKNGRKNETAKSTKQKPTRVSPSLSETKHNKTDYPKVEENELQKLNLQTEQNQRVSNDSTENSQLLENNEPQKLSFEAEVNQREYQDRHLLEPIQVASSLRNLNETTYPRDRTSDMKSGREDSQTENLNLSKNMDLESSETIQNSQFSLRKSKKISLHELQNLEKVIFQLKDVFESGNLNKTQSYLSDKDTNDVHVQEHQTTPSSSDTNLTGTSFAIQKTKAAPLQSSSLSSPSNDIQTTSTVVGETEILQLPQLRVHPEGSSNDVPPGLNQVDPNLYDSNLITRRRSDVLPSVTESAPVSSIVELHTDYKVKALDGLENSPKITVATVSTDTTSNVAKYLSIPTETSLYSAGKSRMSGDHLETNILDVKNHLKESISTTAY